MTRIFDLVNFHTAYGDQVRLLDYYYDEIQNREHMRGYRPIVSHREAFLELAQSQLPSTENKGKVFMLTGSFGTGKSHLCLMLANYFSLKPTDLEMEEFFDNWARRDEAGSQQVRNWRGDGRYLVAPCEFGEARPFEDMVLTAIQTALEHEGADEIILDTHFKGALRQVEAWEQREESGEPSGVFDDFLAFLGGDDPRRELEAMQDNLRQNRSAAMDLFQATYKQATGQKLSFRTDSLLAILNDLLANPQFQKRYKGLVILADEFGYALGEGRVSMSVFQSFAEMSKDGVAGMDLIFIGTGHRRFEAYGANTPLQVDFRVVQDRVTEVTLESAELEQIIAALVSPRTEDPVWQEEVVKNNDWVLNQMASGAKKTGIFDYLSEPELREQIIENIYPVHPMATYCLTKMSQEVGSDARSVFAFFRKYGDPPPEGGYSWFVRTHDVTDARGELSVYTPDLLALYFQPEIATTNLMVRVEVRDHIRNYLGAVEEARRFAYRNTLAKEISPDTQRVLDMVLVYRLSNVNVTPETLQFGLNVNSPSDKKRLSSELKSLLLNRILFLSPSKEYEFRRSTMADLDTMITEARQHILGQPLDIAVQVGSLSGKWLDAWTEAKGHNQDYLGDKRLLRVFAQPRDLSRKYKLADGREGSFWEYHEEHRMAQKGWQERYDGIMVYVLCENDADIQHAQQAVRSNDCPTIIVGVPKSPMLIKEAVVDLMAIQSFMNTEAYDKLEFQEKALVEEILGKENLRTGRFGDFVRARQRYLEAIGMHWYRDDGKTLVSDPLNEYEPADALMNRLFTHRNTVTHEYLNKTHPRRFVGPKDAALHDAVARLVDTDRPVAIDHSEKENRGQIRYLKLALANQGVLVQQGDYVGNVATYELESDPDKYQDRFPALYALIDRLKQIRRGEALNLWGEVSRLTDGPYGLGPYALSVFLGCALRHFGDELRLKINPAALGYAANNDPELVIDLAIGRYPQATVERRFLNLATTRLINEIYSLFGERPAAAGAQQTLAEAWRAVQAWWKARTRLERAVGVYTDDSTTQAFVDFMSKEADNVSGSQLLLEETKAIYGYSADAELNDEDSGEIVLRLQEDKNEIETRARAIKATLVKSLASLFQPAGETYIDYVNAISAWTNQLHPDQKLETADWQTPASRTILQGLPKLQDVEKMFLQTIPQARGFELGKVDDWSHDLSSSYLGLFESALKKIEDSLPKVPEPVWDTSVDPAASYQGTHNVRFSGTVTLKVSTPGDGFTVRVTRTEDPATAKQFETVKAKQPWTTEVTESCSYYLVSESSQGDFSRVVRIGFTNRDEGYKLIAENAPKLEPQEREYRFRNPVDKRGLIVLLRDIIGHLKSDQIISTADIAAAMQEAADTALTDSKG